jgi:hypothetical protein
MCFVAGLDFAELFMAGRFAGRSSLHFCQAGSIARPSRGPKPKAVSPPAEPASQPSWSQPASQPSWLARLEPPAEPVSQASSANRITGSKEESIQWVRALDLCL